MDNCFCDMEVVQNTDLSETTTQTHIAKFLIPIIIYNMNKNNIKNTKQQKALVDCLRAFVAAPKATYAWCLHHGRHYDSIDEPVLERVDYIVNQKPKYEIARRLDNFRPVLDTKRLEAAIKEFTRRTHPHSKAIADRARRTTNTVVLSKLVADMGLANQPYYDWLEQELIAHHLEEWPDTTWDGKDIF